MKKIFYLIVVFLITATTFAQVPNKMSYQSVIRDNKGALISNQKVTIQISVLKGSKDGEAVYIENHTSSTNTNGLVSLEIGGGEIVKGKFADIDWANGSYFIKTATDPNGNSNFDIVGVSELLNAEMALFCVNILFTLFLNRLPPLAVSFVAFSTEAPNRVKLSLMYLLRRSSFWIG